MGLGSGARGKKGTGSRIRIRNAGIFRVKNEKWIIQNVLPLTVNVSHTEEEAKAEAEEVQVSKYF